MEPPLQECVKGDLKKNLSSSKLWCRSDLMSHHPLEEKGILLFKECRPINILDLFV